MTIKELQEDSLVELYETPYYDAVNYSGMKAIGIYHGIDEKIIIQHLQGRLAKYKLYYSNSRETYYFLVTGKRYYLNEFLP